MLGIRNSGLMYDDSNCKQNNLKNRYTLVILAGMLLGLAGHNMTVQFKH